jgi:hypothetical protein
MSNEIRMQVQTKTQYDVIISNTRKLSKYIINLYSLFDLKGFVIAWKYFNKIYIVLVYLELKEKQNNLIYIHVIKLKFLTKKIQMRIKSN